jgi:hypothetical protein
MYGYNYVETDEWVTFSFVVWLAYIMQANQVSEEQTT